MERAVGKDSVERIIKQLPQRERRQSTRTTDWSSFRTARHAQRYRSLTAADTLCIVILSGKKTSMKS